MTHALTSPDFLSLYGRSPDVSAEAPGRVNLMGDHTDYNGGYVLPMTLPHTTRVEAAVRPDRMIQAWSANVGQAETPRQYELGRETRLGDWLDYVQAVTHTLQAQGHSIPGMDVRIATDIPLGAGLSSSASLLVSLLKAIRHVANLRLSDLDIARLTHRAETAFVGAPVGIMDQMVCALGQPQSAFFLDTGHMRYEHVPLPEESQWVVIHSGVSHSHVTGSYQERRQECDQACALLGIAQLRELHSLSRADASTRIEALPAPLNARVRHVFTENERVIGSLKILQRADMWHFGTLMFASHASLRDDFRVSIPETDLLVELARAEQGVYGARLTGGGFGGSVVLAVAAGNAEQIASRITDRYDATSGSKATTILPTGPHSYT